MIEMLGSSCSYFVVGRVAKGAAARADFAMFFQLKEASAMASHVLIITRPASM
jgi:hypothetical protein